MSFGIFQFRRDTAANWTTSNTLLLSGELGLETDTHLFKIGDGVTYWTSLSYGGLIGPTGPTGPSAQPGTQSAATVSFGAITQKEYNTKITISNSSINTSSIIITSLSINSTADHSPDEIMIEDIAVSAGNIIQSTSFDIVAFCPTGTYGQYWINYQITY